MALERLKARVVDRQMIRRATIRELDRRTFRRREIGCLLGFFERTDQRLRETVSNRILVSDCHAAAALIVECDPQANELDHPVRQRAMHLERTRELNQSLRELGTVRE